LELSVEDCGHGIPAEKLGRVFDSFFTTKEHGMGLGLALARSIAEAHGGRLVAKNNPSGGTTFYLVLPINPSA
jgi:signal transduction histidine kinase